MSKMRLLLALLVLFGLFSAAQASPLLAQSNRQEKRDAEQEKKEPELKVVRKVEPVYPPDAMSAGVEGKVTLEVTVETNGEVSGVKVLAGHRLLNQAAIDAIKQWRFSNTFDNAATTQITFNFSAGGDSNAEPRPSQAQDSPLKLVHKVDAVYPEDAKRKGARGEVAVEITVNEEGKVTDARVKSGNEMLQQAALDAVKQFRFENTLQKTVVATITFNFVPGDK